MDGMTRATTENRDRAQCRVLAMTTGAGVAALAVTGFLTVGLGSGSTAATSGTTTPSTTTPSTTTPSTTAGTTSSTAGTATSATSSTSSSSQQAVATSGGS